MENLLIQNLVTNLSRKLSTSNLAQSVQCILNIEYYELASMEFETLLQEKRFAYPGSPYEQQTLSIYSELRKKQKSLCTLQIPSKNCEFSLKREFLKSSIRKLMNSWRWVDMFQLEKNTCNL
jgi:hypothetical protein